MRHAALALIVLTATAGAFSHVPQAATPAPDLPDAMRIAQLEQQRLSHLVGARFFDAMEICEELLELLEAHTGSDPADVATARIVWKLVAEYAASPEALREAIARAIQMNLLAVQLTGLGRLDEARELYRQEIALLQGVVGHTHLETALAYWNLGRIELQATRLPEAIQALRTALAIREEILGPHPQVVEIRTNLAVALSEQGLLEEASQVHEDSLRMLAELDLTGTRLDGEVRAAYGALLILMGRPAGVSMLNEAAAVVLAQLREGDARTASAAMVIATQMGQFDPQQAVALAERALEIAQGVFGPVHKDVADGWVSLGLAHMHLAVDIDAAIDAFRQAESVGRRTMGDSPWLANVLVQLAQAQAHDSRLEQSLTNCEEAVRLSEQLLDERNPILATHRLVLAKALVVAGRLDEADALATRTMDRLAEIFGEQHAAVAVSLSTLANVRQARGLHADAIRLNRRNLEIHIATSGPEHFQTGVSWRNLAITLEDGGDLLGALDAQQRGLRILRRWTPGDTQVLGRTLMDLSRLSAARGDHALAQQHGAEALAVARRLYDSHEFLALALDHMAGLLRESNPTLAESHSHEAYAMRRGLVSDNHPLVATALNNLAEGARQSGRPGEALELQRESARVLESVYGERHAHVAAARANQGLSLSALGDEAGARLMFESSSRLWHDLEGPRSPGSLFADRYLGELLLEQGELDQAACVLERAARTWEQRRQRMGTGLARAAFGAQSPFALLAACRLRQGRPGEAWDALQRERARSLLDALSEHTLLADDALREHGAELLRQLVALEEQRDRAAALDVDGLDADGIERQLEQARAKLARHEAAVLAALDAPAARIPDWRDVVEALPADVALVSWMDQALDGAAPVAWILRRGRSPVTVPLPASTGEDPAAAYLTAVATPPAARTADLDALRNALVAARLTPVLRHLEADPAGPPRRLVLVEPGPMSGVPAASLTDRYIVSMVPSATLCAWLAARPPAAARGGLLALGDPVVTDNLAPLPGTRQEVSALAQLATQAARSTAAHVLLAEDASANALDGMARADTLREQRFIHIATHALIDSDVRASTLVLSDGRLTPSEVLRTWRLDADLVTLSACHSAAGEDQGGEGTAGFARAFLVAGARAVLLSRWPVDDTATTLLMTRTYENLLGTHAGRQAAGRHFAPQQELPAPEALHEARGWLRSLTLADARHAAIRLDLDPTLIGNSGTPRGLPATSDANRPGLAAGTPVTVPTVHPFADPYHWAAFELVSR